MSRLSRFVSGIFREPFKSGPVPSSKEGLFEGLFTGLPGGSASIPSGTACNPRGLGARWLRAGLMMILGFGWSFGVATGAGVGAKFFTSMIFSLISPLVSALFTFADCRRLWHHPASISWGIYIGRTTARFKTVSMYFHNDNLSASHCN